MDLERETPSLTLPNQRLVRSFHSKASFDNNLPLPSCQTGFISGMVLSTSELMLLSLFPQHTLPAPAILSKTYSLFRTNTSLVRLSVISSPQSISHPVGLQHSPIWALYLKGTIAELFLYIVYFPNRVINSMKMRSSPTFLFSLCGRGWLVVMEPSPSFWALSWTAFPSLFCS